MWLQAFVVFYKILQFIISIIGKLEPSTKK